MALHTPVHKLVDLLHQLRGVSLSLPDHTFGLGGIQSISHPVVMMNFLAGFVLGLTGYWLLFKSGLFFTSLYKPVFMILTLFIAVFILGAAWEVFEYTNGMTNSHEGYKVDVLNDLTLDSAGTVLAVLLATRKRKVNV